MKKRIIAMVLVLAMGVVFLAGCTDSSKQTVIQQIDYDPVAEVAKYELGELSDFEKNFVIQMGYNNCDHMVGAIIGELAGIYDALDLNVVVTKTGKIMQAMASGEMHVGYQGITGAIRSVNEGAPLFMAAANHLGGSRYLVASNEIKEPKDLIGKRLAISASSETSPEWIRWCEELGIPVELSNYQVVEMAQADALFAIKAGQLDAFVCCDPYASQAEFEGIGHIMGTGWGAFYPEDESNTGGVEDWGICCIYCMSDDFYDQCPELSKRLVIAHSLAVKYLYEHPYNASMMFAEGFGVAPEVGLKTVYMKTVAEGRTITWEFSEQNLDNYIQYYYDYNIPEKDIPNINDIENFMSVELLASSNVGDFNKFIEEEINPKFPVGDTYEEWLAKAKTIDGIEETTASAK